MISSLYLSVNVEKPESQSVVDELTRTAAEKNMRIVDDRKEADCIVSIGGDGTYLFAARQAFEYDLPLVGIDLGRFGFLPLYHTQDIPAMLDSLNQSEPKERSVIKLGGPQDDFYVVNEVVIERKALRAARFTLTSIPKGVRIPGSDVSLTNQMQWASTFNQEDQAFKGENGQPNFVCDAVIISTSIGSTGYNASLGGPAISPEADVMCVAMKALHHPRISPIVLARGERIYLSAEDETMVICDGRHFMDVEAGDVLFCELADKKIKIFEPDMSYVSRLAIASRNPG